MANLIYKPTGKAKEYSTWACNLYNGCSNKCEYCYNRHGLGAMVLGKDFPMRKQNATMERFSMELLKNKDQIIKDGQGLFFNFVSDPFLDETIVFNIRCALYALRNNVPCIFLSKTTPPAWAVEDLSFYSDLVKIGFTLTGCDELEPNAAPNSIRIETISKLKQFGIKTWASIEPVIDVERSFNMIQCAYNAGCREFKIGLLSGARNNYTPSDIAEFKDAVDMTYSKTCKIYWKNSVNNYISKIK